MKALGQDRFARLYTLGSEYSEAALSDVLAGEKAHKPWKKTVLQTELKTVNLLVHIQAKLGREKCRICALTKVLNLKQMAKMMKYLTENGLLEYAALVDKAQAVTELYNLLAGQIKSAVKRMAEIAVLRTRFINYFKARDAYNVYRKVGYSKKFFAEHEVDILFAGFFK